MQVSDQVAKHSRRRFLKNSVKWLAAPAILGMYSAFVERLWLDIEQQTIMLPRLPAAFSGLRLVQFSDLHLGHFFEPEDLHKLVTTINGLDPDIICFTGDLVDNTFGGWNKTAELLAKTSARLGKWAVLGNHDYRVDPHQVTATLQQAGFQVLRNQHEVVALGEEQLYIVGVDDVLLGIPDIDQAMSNTSREECAILLVHEPDFADQSKHHSIDLQLSGHSHGGQVRLPLIGHLLTPIYGQKYPIGLQQVAGSALQVYTNRGIGTTILPIRFYCRPELTVFTLVSASP